MDTDCKTVVDYYRYDRDKEDRDEDERDVD
jgi:hypothetical protein